MNTSSYLTAAVATAQIDSRIREARNQRLVAEVRRTSRPAGTTQPEACCPPTRRAWFSRPATA